jgi:hypothetical protein
MLSKMLKDTLKDTESQFRHTYNSQNGIDYCQNGTTIRTLYSTLIRHDDDIILHFDNLHVIDLRLTTAGGRCSLLLLFLPVRRHRPKFLPFAVIPGFQRGEPLCRAAGELGRSLTLSDLDVAPIVGGKVTGWPFRDAIGATSPELEIMLDLQPIRKEVKQWMNAYRLRCKE